MYELIVDYTRTRDECDSAIHQYGVYGIRMSYNMSYKDTMKLWEKPTIT